MKNYKLKLILVMALLTKFGFSGLARHDINWLDYEEFGMNNGKYEIGKKGIIVYKKDGKVSGIIEQPMPNFDGVPNGTGGGGAGMWDDPQILTTVTHIVNPKGKRADLGFNFLGRHMRKDVNLYKNYKSNISGNNKNRENEISKFSEVSKTKHHIDVGGDFSFVRLDKINHDAITYDTLNYDDYKSKVRINDLIARMGSGSNSVFTVDDKFVEIADPFRVAGGLNKLTNKYVRGDVENVLNIYLERKAKTPIDIGTMGGDSGSPVFWWDKNEEKWKVIANNSAGIHSRGEKGSVLLNGVQHIEKFKKRVTDTEIVDTMSVSFDNGRLIVNDNDIRTFDKSDFENKLMINHITKNNIEIDDKFFKVKNQVFNKEGLVINLVGNTDTSIARLDFKKDAIIQGDGTLKTAGIVIDKNVTVTYKANIGEGNIVRKVGEGILKIEGNTQNEGDINIGGNGVLLLNNSTGYAAKNIRLAQHATVKLLKNNQINGNNIYFGLRGGTLDLNSQNINFVDIYHIDKGAIISNSDGNNKSIFKFNPNDSEERTYLGSFSKNLDVVYASSNNNSRWNLRGNSDIEGSLNIEKGTVSIGGDVIVHGYDNIVGKDEYSRITFKSNEINVKSNLEINRAVEVNSKINIENGAKLDIKAVGKVLEDNKLPYKDSPSEKEINRIVLKNEINFKENNPLNKNLIFDIQNNNEVSIESKITGKIKSEKMGDGLVSIRSFEGNTVDGNLDIKAGKVKLFKDNSLGNVNIKLENSSILEVEDISTLSNILPKINKDSIGVLSLGKDIANIDENYRYYSKLFLGSSKNIVIGSENAAISTNITKLNLGGDNGTVTLKGLNLSSHITDVNIGDGVNKGKVIIDKIASNNNFNIEINKGVELEIRENASVSKLINLNYGSYISFENKAIIKETSEGVLYLKNNVENIVVNDNKAYIGAKKGETEISLNSLETGNKEYRISGDGVLNVNFNLDKNLTVDAQYLDGGEVNIKTSNTNYSGIVTVIGNKNNENNGNITLKLDAIDSLGSENTFNIKSGGNVDLNGYDLSLKIGETDKYGSIINNALNKHSTLKIIADNVTVVNNKILGNSSEIEKSSDINIVKVGNNSIEFTNSENNFKKLSIESGTLIYKNENSLRDTEIHLNSGTKLDAATAEISSHIIANNANIKFNNNNKLYTGNTVVKELTLKSDITISGDRPNRKTSITYRKINIGEHNLILSTQTMRFGEIVKTEGKRGTVTLANSSIGFLTGDKNKTLNEALSKLVIVNSQLMLRDYKSNILDRNDVNHTLVEINGFSSIKNGWYNDRDLNGGGGGANFNNPILINSASTLTFENNSQFGMPFTIDSNISGSGKIRLEANNTAYPSTKRSIFKITSNFKDFNGTLEVTGKDQNNKEHIFQIDDENEENRTISYKIINQGKFKNMSTRDLIFKNLSEFSGELKAENGDIVLSGYNGINTFATINLINDKNLTLNSDENIIINKNLTVNITDNPEESNVSKIIKKGSGKVHLEENVIINKAKSILVDLGELSLTKDVLEKNDDSKYEVSRDAKLTFDLSIETTLNSIITGNGNLEHKGSKLTIDSTKLKNRGNLILNNELEINVNNDINENKTILSSTLKGSENSKLTLLNSDNTLEINKDISEFKGIFNLKEANLNLNIENANINNNIIGDKTLSNVNSSTLNIGNGINNFSGIIDAKNGDINLNIQEVPNISKYVLSGANIMLNSDNDLEFSNKIFENKTLDNKIIKDGSGSLILTPKNLEDIKNISVNKGNLTINGNNSENKIDTNIHLSNETTITLEDNTYVKNIENATVIDLVDKNLKIEKYKTIDEGKFNITLNEMNKKVLEIEDSNNNVNINLNLNSELVKNIKENGEKLLVTKSNKDVNILNLEKDYETLYGLYALRDGNNVEILSKVTPKTFNSLYVLNELNYFNTTFNRSKFKNSFSINYINYVKKDNDFIKFGDTDYRNKLIANGFEGDLELVKEFSNSKLSLGLNYTEITNYVNSEVFLNNKIIFEDNTVISKSFLSRLAYKFNNFEINTSIGYNNVKIIKDFEKIDYANFLKTKFSLSYNKNYKINESLNLNLSNTIGFTYSPMISENITKIYDTVDNVKNITPFAVFYESSAELSSRYLDFYLRGYLLRNFSKISLNNKNEKINNFYKDNYRAEFNVGIALKPIENIAIQADLLYKLNKINYSSYTLKLGLNFTW